MLGAVLEDGSNVLWMALGTRTGRGGLQAS